MAAAVTPTATLLDITGYNDTSTRGIGITWFCEWNHSTTLVYYFLVFKQSLLAVKYMWNCIGSVNLLSNDNNIVSSRNYTFTRSLFRHLSTPSQVNINSCKSLQIICTHLRLAAPQVFDLTYAFWISTIYGLKITVLEIVFINPGNLVN